MDPKESKLISIGVSGTGAKLVVSTGLDERVESHLYNLLELADDLKKENAGGL